MPPSIQPYRNQDTFKVGSPLVSQTHFSNTCTSSLSLPVYCLFSIYASTFGVLFSLLAITRTKRGNKRNFRRLIKKPIELQSHPAVAWIPLLPSSRRQGCEGQISEFGCWEGQNSSFQMNKILLQQPWLPSLGRILVSPASLEPQGSQWVGTEAKVHGHAELTLRNSVHAWWGWDN